MLRSMPIDGDRELLNTTLQVIKASRDKKITDKDVLTNFMDGNKRTVLHFAAAKGRRKMLELLLSKIPE